MGSAVLNSIVQMLSALSSWFTAMLDATGTGAIYIGFVTIALAVSFLLSRFGALLHLGSDTAQKIHNYGFKEGEGLIQAAKKKKGS